MDRQQEFVLRTIEERDIRFVRLWFTDVLGGLKSVAVAPAELEAVLINHPEIADAAVIGVPEKESGEELPKAFVVRAQGSELTEAGVMAYMAEKVAPHKKIRFVEFIDEVPKSSAGKILRKELKARAVELGRPTTGVISVCAAGGQGVVALLRAQPQD